MQANPTSHPRIMPVQPSTTCRWLRGLGSSPCAALALLLLGPSATQATPIPTWLGGSPRPADWAVIADATYNNGGTTRSVAGSTDVGSANGSGLNLVAGTWYNTPTTGAAESMEGWGANSHTNSTATDAGINNGYFQYTFDKAYTVTGFMMWNTNNQGKRRGTQIMQFQTTTDGVNWDPQIWTDGTDAYNGARTHNAAATTGTLTATGTNTWQATQSPLESGGTVPATDVYSGLNWANVIAVRFAPRASYDDEAAGVSEIQFTFTPFGFQGPSWLTATDANTQVTLNWGAVTDATGYKVYRALTDSGTYEWLADVSGATTYTNTGLTNGTTYYYVVTAINSSDTESLYSLQAAGTATAPPAEGPTGLTAATPNHVSVTLGWDAVTGATGYKVYRTLTDDGTYEWLADVSDATTYTDAVLPFDITYYYVVTATNISGESPYSAQVSATQTPGTDLWVNATPRPANWAVITNSTYYPNGSGRAEAASSAVGSVNGSGLSLVAGTWYNTPTSDADESLEGWGSNSTTNSTATDAGINNGYFQYTFDKAYTVTGFMMWNINKFGKRRGTQIMQFQTTTDGVNWDPQIWTDGTDAYNGARTHNAAATTGTLTATGTNTWQATQSPLESGGTVPATDVYSGLNWANVIAVRFAPRASYADEAAGVSEIQFTIAGVTPDSYTAWLTNPPLWTLTGDDAAKTADPDGDGMSNFQEFAFGLNPVLGASVNPITAPLDKDTRKFSYTRGAATGLNYTVWVSTDLLDWGADPVAAEQLVGEPIDGVRIVEVTLPDSLPAGGKVFVRVQAE